jgi:hypothetical protein
VVDAGRDACRLDVRQHWRTNSIVLRGGEVEEIALLHRRKDERSARIRIQMRSGDQLSFLASRRTGATELATNIASSLDRHFVVAGR